MPANKNIKKVLVAPLDWGLGHATRCIPLIRALLSADYEVVLAAEGAQASLLQTEFPALPCLPLEGYRVSYSKKPARLALTLLGQLPRLLRTIKSEHRWLEQVIKDHAIDLVISDNRFGLFTQQVACVFITHQLLIKAPFTWLERWMQAINYRYINKYTVCWVPDMKGDKNLAGALSHPIKMPATPVTYIGLLSRFYEQPAVQRYDVCILLSGPEPQRTLLEEKLLKDIDALPGKIILVRGKPGSDEVINDHPHVKMLNHLGNDLLQEVLLQSDIVISRSGYTTVMELLSLKKKAIFIPTPGQTEQEYLAKKLYEEGYAYTVTQEALDIVKDLETARRVTFRQNEWKVFTSDRITGLIDAIGKKQGE